MLKTGNDLNEINFGMQRRLIMILKVSEIINTCLYNFLLILVSKLV